MSLRSSIYNSISRIILAIITAPFSLKNDSIPTPECFHIYLADNIPEHIKIELVKCYQQVFSEEPWLEDWSEDDVLSKLKNDLAGDPMSFLVTYSKDDKVQGFSWGSIIPGRDIVSRASKALNIEADQIDIRVPAKNKVLYCDEFAISKNARKGTEPVRNILKKFLMYGHSVGVKATIFWSTPDSKIVPLASYMGYKYCGSTFNRGNKIIFLLNKDFRSLLKLTLHFRPSTIMKVLSLYSNRGKKEET